MGEGCMSIKITLSHISEKSVDVVMHEVNKLMMANLCRVHVAHVVDTEPFHEDLNNHPHRFVNGMRNKGISGPDLVLQILDTGPASKEEIESVMDEHHFARSSSSSLLSKLQKSEQIVRRPDGKFIKVPEQGEEK
jgi:hypothetical protein